MHEMYLHQSFTYPATRSQPFNMNMLINIILEYYSHIIATYMRPAFSVLFWSHVCDKSYYALYMLYHNAYNNITGGHSGAQTMSRARRTKTDQALDEKDRGHLHHCKLLKSMVVPGVGTHNVVEKKCQPSEVSIMATSKNLLIYWEHVFIT